MNRTRSNVEAVFSFNAKNFMALGGNPQAVRSAPGGFTLWGGPGQDKPWEDGAFSATVSDPETKVNLAWFRGGWWDPLTMAWKDIANAAAFDRPAITEGAPAPGASLFVPFTGDPKVQRLLNC